MIRTRSAQGKRRPLSRRVRNIMRREGRQTVTRIDRVIRGIMRIGMEVRS
jgi:hypothetical protein